MEKTEYTFRTYFHFTKMILVNQVFRCYKEKYIDLLNDIMRVLVFDKCYFDVKKKNDKARGEIRRLVKIRRVRMKRKLRRRLKRKQDLSEEKTRLQTRLERRLRRKLRKKHTKEKQVHIPSYKRMITT